MAKYGLYRERIGNYLGEDSFFYMINTLEDVMNIKMAPFRKFDNFRTLLKTKTEKIGKRLAKRIMNDFFSMLADDIIYEGDCFVFPKKDFGYLKIGDATDETRDDYVYNIDTDGIYYSTRLRLGGGIISMNQGRLFKFRFNQVNRIKMKKLIEDGKRY